MSNANNFLSKYEDTTIIDGLYKRKSVFNNSSINNYFADRKCIITYAEISSTICTSVQKYLKPIISVNNQQDILNERLRELEIKKHNLGMFFFLYLIKYINLFFLHNFIMQFSRHFRCTT